LLLALLLPSRTWKRRERKASHCDVVCQPLVQCQNLSPAGCERRNVQREYESCTWQNATPGIDAYQNMDFLNQTEPTLEVLRYLTVAPLDVRCEVRHRVTGRGLIVQRALLVKVPERIGQYEGSICHILMNTS